MIVVGIDVAKDKHDCFVMNSDGEILRDVFTISNDLEGFNYLLNVIKSFPSSEKIRIGLEATGHYSYNIIGFLYNNDLPVFVLNPLLTNIYRKSTSLRKTKTDRIDARNIAAMLLSSIDLKSYSNIAYHNEELKSLTRYLFNKIKDRSRLRQSISRLVNILFPELEKIVSTLHSASIYTLLLEYPSAKDISNIHLTHLSKLLSNASNGKITKDKAIEIRETARSSIGSLSPAKSLELVHTIRMAMLLDEEILEIETNIDSIMQHMDSPITTIPGIGKRTAAMIIAEIGDFAKFESPDKILAYAGLSPSTYQSGHLNNCHSHMEKRGSKYLRYALYIATKNVCIWDDTFADYLSRKRSEGKHYTVAISHAAKKLVRLIFALEKTRLSYR